MKMLKLIPLLLASLLCMSLSAQEVEADIIPQDQLIYLQTSEGLVVIELAPFIAPNHVNQFKALVSEGFYDGLDFYRVIDGFVVQGGDQKEDKKSQHKKALKAEFTRPASDKSDFYIVQSPEFLAEKTGYIKGFAAGRSDSDNVEWLLHCPGAVAMARTNDKDSGTTDFYIVIGHAPRQLDRNMSVFGQVIYGMQNVQSIRRGDPRVNSGVIEDPAARSTIITASVGSDLSVDKQMSFERPNVKGENYQQRLKNARSRSNDFFHYKGSGKIDVCYYRPKPELVKSEN